VVISPEQHNVFMAKPEVIKRITKDIDVQVTLTERVIKLRGVSSDVKDIKTRIMEQITGTFETYLDLEPSHYAIVSKAAKDPSHFGRIRENTSTKISLDVVSNSIIISGKRGNVRKAKNQLMALLELLFPSEFVRVKMTKPVLKAIGKPAVLAKISAECGASIFLDRELNCIQIRSNDPEEVCKAKNRLETKIAESEKLNIVIKVDLDDAWLLPKIIGKDGVTVDAIVAETGCKIEVSKAESTIAIVAETAEIASTGKIAVEKVINQARKENVFITIPDSAMPAFIGKGGESIRKLAKKHIVEIERLRKDKSTIQIKGNEKSVEAASTAVMEWLSGWESANVGFKLSVECSLIAHVMGKGGSVINAIQKDTRTKIDVNRRNGIVTIRSDNESSQNEAIQKINAVLKVEREKLTVRKNELDVNRESLLAEKMELDENIEVEVNDSVSAINGSHDVNNSTQSKSFDVSSDIISKPLPGKSKMSKIENITKMSKIENSTKMTSQASQSLYNMLISDPSKDGDSSTISSIVDAGHEDDGANDRSTPSQKTKVYKSSSGFSVRV